MARLAVPMPEMLPFAALGMQIHVYTSLIGISRRNPPFKNVCIRFFFGFARWIPLMATNTM